MGTKIHFGPPGPCFFGGRQATYEKELRELREKLAKRQAYLEEGEVPIFVGLKGHNIVSVIQNKYGRSLLGADSSFALMIKGM